VVLGAWLFGGVTILQLNLQASGLAVQAQYLNMTPYLMTILVLVVISADRTRAAFNARRAWGGYSTNPADAPEGERSGGRRHLSEPTRS
jgi:ABC-type uncharacterized transport system permease subunit